MHPVLPRAALLGVLAALVAAPPAGADVVVPDDQIVQGSVCAGPDCVNNESFGFDTVRLKGPALRLGVHRHERVRRLPDDRLGARRQRRRRRRARTATSRFQDTTAGTTPLRVLASAPTDTLRVEADGSVRLPTGALLQRVDATTTENVTAVDGDALVTALGSLPLSSYEYTADAANTRHLGPTAAAFNTAFGARLGHGRPRPGRRGRRRAGGDEGAGRARRRPHRPAGAKGEPGAPGAKGDTGPKGADARPSDGLAAALKRLKTLEQAQQTAARPQRRAAQGAAQAAGPAMKRRAALLGAGLALALAAPAHADDVVADDQIVQGAECVGFDCVDGEDFGTDTLRLKENNTRLAFDDTTATGGSANDWEVTANDRGSGGRTTWP